jgi:uncharacterized protein YjbI with pentapeptide repeats
VVINWDDSDGWYDHVYSGVTNPSLSPADNLTNTSQTVSTTGTSGQCGPSPQTSPPLTREQGRCGFGPRIPMLVVSPCARQNAVDSNLSDQASVVNFIEYNWNLPSIQGSADQVLASKDAAAGNAFDLAGMFNFQCNAPAVILDPATGQIDLRNADLGGQNFVGSDLEGAELSAADLKGANANDAFLANADLAGASLGGTNLGGSDLADANLTGATLPGANLGGADLTGANLTGARLRGTNISAVTWSNTTCPDGTNSNADGGTCAGHL